MCQSFPLFGSLLEHRLIRNAKWLEWNNVNGEISMSSTGNHARSLRKNADRFVWIWRAEIWEYRDQHSSCWVFHISVGSMHKKMRISLGHLAWRKNGGLSQFRYSSIFELEEKKNNFFNVCHLKNWKNRMLCWNSFGNIWNEHSTFESSINQRKLKNNNRIIPIKDMQD